MYFPLFEGVFVTQGGTLKIFDREVPFFGFQ